MNGATENKIMEALTELYENHPYLQINDFYIDRGCNDGGVVVHFSTFGDGACRFVNDIAKKYKCSWVIQRTMSIDGDFAVNFY